MHLRPGPALRAARRLRPGRGQDDGPDAADAYSLLPASGRAGANKMQPGEDEEDNDDDDETVIYGGNDEDEGDGRSPPPSMGRASRSGENRTTRCVQ